MKSYVQVRSSRSLARGVTLIEVLVAIGLGSLVLAAVGFLSLFGARSSLAMANYTDLEFKSRYALDVISRELRQATAVLSFQTNLPFKSLTFTNADQGATVVLTWDSNARTVSFQKSGQSTFTPLTSCDRFDFYLYQRTPLITPTNVIFYPATNITGVLDPSICKLINLSWKCSRTILTQKINTESVQAAQIVLRNKQ
jgi:prepilin-type N-terminal cleavage/methylation domain-containing protein